MMHPQELLWNEVDMYWEWLEMMPADERWQFIAQILAGKLLQERQKNERSLHVRTK